MMGEKYVIPEVLTDSEWLVLTGQRELLQSEQADRLRRRVPMLQSVKPNQLMVIDVFTEWSGPCIAIESHLRRLRHSFVEAPDTLALARACCDHISQLEPFKSDSRPTFLFWARGGPVALLRGANRPLLTKLIQQEVDIEVNQKDRGHFVVDFQSDKVIQCSGELACLDSDQVVRSIGEGSTDCLSTFFELANQSASVKSKSEEALGSMSLEAEQPPVQDNNNGGSERDELPEEPEADPNLDTDEAEGQLESYSYMDNESDDDYEDEDDDQLDVEEAALASGMEQTRIASNCEAGDEPPENPFGVKRRKKRRKMETGLLKEILDSKTPRQRAVH